MGSERPLEIEGYRFLQLPRPLARAAYERARAEFVAAYDKVQGVHAIYRIGSVSYPGLSDLDFIVVLDDDYRPAPGVTYTILAFREETRYALYHPQIFLPRRLFPCLSLLVPIFELEHVAGQECPPPTSDAEELRQARLFFLCESFITDFAWSLTGFLGERRINLRMAQAKLNLVVKNIALLEDLTGVGWSGGAGFAASVQELRSSWFSRPQEQVCRQTIELLVEAQRIVAALMHAFDQYVQGAPYRKLASPETDGAQYGYHNVAVVFGSKGKTVQGRGHKFLMAAPLSVAIPPMCLASGSGPASRYVRNHFDVPPPRVDFSAFSGLVKIVEAANAHCRFLRERGITTGHFRYFGYRGDYSPGLRTMLRRATSRLRKRQ